MNRDIRILLIEDNDGDIVLTLEALKEVRINNRVDVVKDGEMALQFLMKEGGFRDVITPNLILLDINLPKIDGKEVLATIKKDEVLRTIPVVILTTSNSEKDIAESYSNHANCYIIKPAGYQDFIDVLRTVKDFWITIAQLPEKNIN